MNIFTVSKLLMCLFVRVTICWWTLLCVWMRKVVLSVCVTPLRLVFVISVFKEIVMGLLVILIKSSTFPFFELLLQFFICLVISLCIFSCLLFFVFSLFCLLLIKIEQILLAQRVTFLIRLKPFVSFLHNLKLLGATS